MSTSRCGRHFRKFIGASFESSKKSTTTLKPGPSTFYSIMALESSDHSSSLLTAAPQLDALNGIMTKSGVSKNWKEIRNVLQELKRELRHVAKLDESLSALDACADRLEGQLETAVNTLHILDRMQADMNSAFCQFKNDIVQRLKKSLKSQNAEDVEESGDMEEKEERGEVEASPT